MTNETEESLASLHNRLIELNEDREVLKRGHAENLRILDREIVSVREAIAGKAAGLDWNKVKRGLNVISLRGTYGTGGGDSRSVIDDAMSDLAQSRGSRLKKEYFGVKNYDRFFRQRSDHSYGFGPRHGSIVFAVGLADVRSELSDEQIDDAMYVLLNLVKIENAREHATIAS